MLSWDITFLFTKQEEFEMFCSLLLMSASSLWGCLIWWSSNLPTVGDVYPNFRTITEATFNQITYQTFSYAVHVFLHMTLSTWPLTNNVHKYEVVIVKSWYCNPSSNSLLFIHFILNYMMITLSNMNRWSLYTQSIFC